MSSLSLARVFRGVAHNEIIDIPVHGAEHHAGCISLLESTNARRMIAAETIAQHQKLRDEVAKALEAPDAIKTLDLQGMLPRAIQPDKWRAYLQSQFATYTKIVKGANLKL
jgi:tripartite-type tricarboxylate transporter receptor subunit TctC